MFFLGRSHEIGLLNSIEKKRKAALTVVYGRRRVGKTRMIGEAFKDHTVWKFEGVEGENTARQKTRFLHRLTELTGRHELSQMKPGNWSDLFTLLAQQLPKPKSAKAKPIVLFLDEFQWMAAGRNQLVSEFKYVWDNLLSKLRVHVVLCGSICSFLVNNVVRSKSLYGRIHLEIPLGPLRIDEIEGVFRPKRSLRDLAELYMVVGGVPQYLEFIEPNLSVRANVEKLCFTRTGYLVEEFERIFVSQFGSTPHYRKILKTLGAKPCATRQQLQKVTTLSGGGRITAYLEELSLAGFIEGYPSVDRPGAVHQTRYRLADPYMRFYFRFIEPALAKIRKTEKPVFSQFVSDRRWETWRGLAFERLCAAHAARIADKLGFGAVRYDVGSWYAKDQPAAQIDLMFLRGDGVAVICELKFTDKKISRSIIAEVEKKRVALTLRKPHTIETVLITATEPTPDLVEEGYFNRILTLYDLFD